MKIEQLDDGFRSVAEQLLAFVEALTGSRPKLARGFYKASAPGRAAVYIQFIGRGGSKHPPRSMWVHTRWRDDLAGAGVTEGNNWYGVRPSAAVTALADRPGDVLHAQDFIRRALQQTA
jgi:hypothetical protein